MHIPAVVVDGARPVREDSAPSYNGSQNAAGIEPTRHWHGEPWPSAPGPLAAVTGVQEHGQRIQATKWLADVPGYAQHNPDEAQVIEQKDANPIPVIDTSSVKSGNIIDPSGTGDQLVEALDPTTITSATLGTLSERDANGTSHAEQTVLESGGEEMSPWPVGDIKPSGDAPPLYHDVDNSPDGQNLQAELSAAPGTIETARVITTGVDVTQDNSDLGIKKHKHRIGKHDTSKRDHQIIATTRHTGSTTSPLAKVIHGVGFSAGIALLLLVYYRPWKYSR